MYVKPLYYWLKRMCGSGWGKGNSEGLKLLGWLDARSGASSKLRAVVSVVGVTEARLRTPLLNTPSGLGAGSLSWASLSSAQHHLDAGIQTTERWEGSLTPLQSPGLATDFTRHISDCKQILRTNSFLLSLFPLTLQHSPSPQEQMKTPCAQNQLAA